MIERRNPAAYAMVRHRPSFEEFASLAAGFRCAPVHRRLSGDGHTPVSAFKRIEKPGASFLFESVIGGEKVGRFSFVGADPFMHFEARGKTVTIRSNRVPSESKTYQAEDPLAELQKLLDQCEAPPAPGLPRFAGGGAVGFAGYDSARYIEKLPNIPTDDRGLPDLRFAFHDRMLVFDHIRKTIVAAGVAFIDSACSLRSAYNDACDRVDELVDRLFAPGQEFKPSDLDTDISPSLEQTANLSREEFEAIVRKCQEYIKAGDIFQVVPSRRVEVRTRADAFDIFRVLRVVNPSPFLFYLGFEDFQLIGSSPEILVRVEDREVTIRPLAGTRRRGKDETEDKALRPSSWRIPRSGRSISCSWTWEEMMWAGWPNPRAFGSRI